MNRMIDIVKKVAIALALVTSLVTAKADGIILTSMTANTASNLLSGSYIVTALSVISTTTNLTTAKFFDSSTTATNYAQLAYTNWTSYATNFSTVFTNEAGVLVTNTYAGLYTAGTLVASNLVTRPLVYTIQAPGSMVSTKSSLFLIPIKGLTAITDQNCTIAVTYKNNPY